MAAPVEIPEAPIPDAVLSVTRGASPSYVLWAIHVGDGLRYTRSDYADGTRLYAMGMTGCAVRIPMRHTATREFIDREIAKFQTTEAGDLGSEKECSTQAGSGSRSLP